MLRAIFTFILMGMGFYETLEGAQERFLWNPNHWHSRVYLATFPRSGNHWMRYLIEEATGIATSSVYQDPDERPHLDKIFPWGGYCADHGYEGFSRYPVKGETVVVKTHFPVTPKTPYDGLSYFKAIRIIRYPVDSFYSNYCLAYANNIEYMMPRHVIEEYIQVWRQFQEYWDSAENTLTIRYEDLYDNPLPYLKLILEEIGYPVTQEDLERAVAKYPPKGGFCKHLSHFTEDDLSTIYYRLGDLYQKYGYEIKSIVQAMPESGILKLSP